MPAQKYVDKYNLKTLSMEPIGIPPNNSQQHLMHDCDTIDVMPNLNPIKDRPSENQGVTRGQWLTVAILCFVNLINYMDRYTIAGILKDISVYYQIGDDKAGLLQTAFVLSYMLFAPVFGYLGDRYSRRLIMAFGVFLWSLTTLLGSFMTEYYWFLAFRSLVGIGEASYSTIAPTIISDLFVDDTRSKMLSLFYFAIPVGSGLGYIVGSETARMASAWQWGLRVTPVLGAVAVILIAFLMVDPPRGESDGNTGMESTTWKEDINALLRNKSFMLSTGGFTCVAFVTGALAWWGPRFIDYGLQIQAGTANKDVDSSTTMKFGILAMIGGIIGVPCGSLVSVWMRKWLKTADPLICTGSISIGLAFLFAVLLIRHDNEILTYSLTFFALLFLNVPWAIMADMGLYVVTPNRRSTAEAFQILVSHALGDAGSPYLVGVISEALKKKYSAGSGDIVPIEVEYQSLQDGLFSTCFVEVLGGVFFLITSFYIVKDKAAADSEISGNDNAVAPTHLYADDPQLNCSEANLTQA
ncbi:lysolipid transporter protein spinster isoform X2 [Rhodnius prolixus]|uniref:lysolipid transporter protein spinster isoform X2 n=1 Tax=Rhodnius prolixus TaxID=13249 RepID=UPI003D18B5D1